MDTAADSRSTRPPGGVHVLRAGTLVTLRVGGHLDASSGMELLAALQQQLDGATRVDIDLLAVTGATPEGSRTLRRARSLSGRLVDGLHFRTDTGVAQQALLDAFTDDEPGEALAD